MKLPQLKNFDFKGKRVLVRCDLDVPVENGKVMDDTRLRECLPTIKYLLDHGASLILMGHLGRPGGKVVEDLSLRPVAQKFKELLSSKLKVKSSKLKCKIENFETYLIDENIVLLENLRFDPREEKNDLGFAEELARLGEFYFRGVAEKTSWPSSKSEDVSRSGETAYINEAFAASHREHASIVGVPKFLPHCAGLHFASEVENLSKVIENPKRPVVVVIGGAKPETKLSLVTDFARVADWVLVGGTLCQMSNVKCQNQMSNVKCARLTKDGFDISKESIKEFSEIIAGAGTVVWNGPMGKYEYEKFEAGTRKIAEAIGDCGGFRVVGGGDTIAALTKFGLLGKMDYVSTGGGAMLEFLTKGTLPGIEALK